MKRLGFALSIVTFALLVIGKVGAVPIYESMVESHFEGSAADGGVYSYEVFNEGNAEAGNIIVFGVYFDVNIYETTLSIEMPPGWIHIPFGLNEVYFTSSGGIVPGTSLDGFKVEVTFEDPGGPVPLIQPYSVNWDTGGYQDSQTQAPEPATLLLLGGGLIAIVGYAVRRKRKQN